MEKYKLTKEEILALPGGPLEAQPRVRFAPSPTGSLHVGGARTYLFNWLYARHVNGKIVIRVEDTDRERSTPEFERMVLNDIRNLNLEYDEGPYRQSERLENYVVFASAILEKGLAYRCFCTESDLDTKAKAAKEKGKPPHYDGTCTHLSPEESQRRSQEESFAIRMAVPSKDYILRDHIRGNITFKRGMVGDFILLRSNGVPVYNFAVVVDDYLMHISHVIRAEEHMPNSLRQMMIMEALDIPQPTFAHISLVLGNDRKKLSKRHGAASVDDYLREGYLSEALVNFLALLGWSPSDNKEICSLSKIVENFHLEKLTKSPAIFDTEKLRWMNGEYIRAMDRDALLERLRPFVKKAGYDIDQYGKEWFLRVLDSVHEGLHLLSDIGPALEIYYPETYGIDDEARAMLTSPEAQKVVGAFQEELEAQSEASVDTLMAIQNGVKAKTGLKGKALFMPLRACITGKLKGPELKLVFPLIGKEEALRRVGMAQKISSQG